MAAVLGRLFRLLVGLDGRWTAYLTPSPELTEVIAGVEAVPAQVARRFLLQLMTELRKQREAQEPGRGKPEDER
jgi:hypothetical protein